VKDVMLIMANVNLTMTGLSDLSRLLESFAQNEDVKKEALEKAGEHLRSAIQNSVPVRTGALKAAIIKGEVIDGKVQIGPSQQGPEFRAHFVEFGTVKMSAQPFMRPTFEQEKSTVEQIMADEIRRGLGL
jgi:HK97 gp10 family phage protein